MNNRRNLPASAENDNKIIEKEIYGPRDLTESLNGVRKRTGFDLLTIKYWNVKQENNLNRKDNGPG